MSMFTDFTDDEKAKVERWLSRQIVDLGFRMEEMGTRPEAKTVAKWWTNQLNYYKYARKYCRWLTKQLNRRDNFMGSERP